MSAPHLTPDQASAAQDTANRLGAAFVRARTQAGDQQKNVAYRLKTRRETVSRFETGAEVNVRLTTIMRFLGAYGLKLAVVAVGEGNTRAGESQ
jgi:transcriptional regulator with XRE-family HTH domain